jgi:50S ribosomal protein L16 3-hydroxylase
MAPLRRLGTLPVADFVARYWQQRALCIRQVVAGFASPIAIETLFALAADPDVESRVVTAQRGRWKLHHGPFEAADLPARRRAAWTLLVQGVDLHHTGVAALAARFRFLPAARFDDVMISFATDGGGVGPHVDQYDVFLLQAQGRRRWRVARRFDPALVEDLPLKVLANFRHEQEWLLEAGDALYLPPGVAHEGVAIGDCVTISIGFRLPTWQEVVDAWHDRQARVLWQARAHDSRVPDATRRATTAPARVPAAMVDVVTRELQRIAPTRREAGRTLLEHLTEPKPSVVFDPPQTALGLARFIQAASRRGVTLDLRSRMLFQGMDIAINGELAPATRAAGPQLRLLANQRHLEGGAWAAASTGAANTDHAALLALLHLWYRSGWLHLGAL